MNNTNENEVRHISPSHLGRVGVGLFFLFAISFMGYNSFMGYKVVHKINHKKAVAEHIKTMPEFSYQTIDGKLFTNKSLLQDTPTVFLYFNSECEHCQSEATQIRDNVEKFANVQLIFISFEAVKKITSFATKHKLIGYDKITFLSDKQVSFATTFDVNSLPTVIIYAQNNKLLAKIKGEVKIENILKKIDL